MTFLHAVVLGIVEGVTEFLPVSSTAHLILTSHLLRLEQTEFQKTFDIAIQLGAILAVVVLYARSLLRRFDVWLRVIVAFAPTAVLGALFYRVIKQNLMESIPVVLWALLLGGIALILFEYFHREKGNAVEDPGAISFRQAFTIGLCQSLAFVPGVSRAAATIVGGLLLGIRRKTIVEFSFLLAVPTMAAAAGLDLLQTAPSFSGREFGLLAAGFLTSFVVALLSILWLLRFVQRRSFTLFGIYRILLAVLLWTVLV
ncbi:MAG: undecaprenyl-diphosphatase UppP [Candidatus Peribacteraceae bacterium]|jgi:undecaprenyl-diphosphatase